MHLLLQHDLDVIARGRGVPAKTLRTALSDVERVVLTAPAAPRTAAPRLAIPAPRASIEQRVKAALTAEISHRGWKPVLLSVGAH